MPQRILPSPPWVRPGDGLLPHQLMVAGVPMVVVAYLPVLIASRECPWSAAGRLKVDQSAESVGQASLSPRPRGCWGVAIPFCLDTTPQKMPSGDYSSSFLRRTRFPA